METRDKQADGSMPRGMQVASIERIESLKKKLFYESELGMIFFPFVFTKQKFDIFI